MAARAWDLLRVTGANGPEAFAAAATLGRVILTRGGAGLVNAGGVERLALEPRGGADAVTLEDLAPAGVTGVDLDLGLRGAGDGAADAVTVNGGSAGDTIQAAAAAGGLEVTGLGTRFAVTRSEPAGDRLTIAGLGGNDTLRPGPSRPSCGQRSTAVTATTRQRRRRRRQPRGGAGNDSPDARNGDGTDVVDGAPAPTRASRRRARPTCSRRHRRRREPRADAGGRPRSTAPAWRRSRSSRAAARTRWPRRPGRGRLDAVNVDLGADGAADVVTVDGTGGADTCRPPRSAAPCRSRASPVPVTIAGSEAAADRSGQRAGRQRHPERQRPAALDQADARRRRRRRHAQRRQRRRRAAGRRRRRHRRRQRGRRHGLAGGRERHVRLGPG